MERVSPLVFLNSAQTAMAQNKYDEAAGHLTNLIKAFPKISPSIALLHRCNCYYHTKEYQKCIDDGKSVLTFPDQDLKEVIIEGCNTFHATVKRRIAEAYTAMGQPEKAKEYVEDCESIQKSFLEIEKSQKLREEGNELYKTGDVENALKKYKEAFDLNSKSEIICGNICAAYLKLENIKEAEVWVNRSLELKPNWQKGHYRKGLIMMKKNEYLQSMIAFNECLKITPNDSEVRKMYNEVAKLCREHGPNEEGFPKEIINKLKEIQKNSWDIFKWFTDDKEKIRYFGMEKWEREVVKHLIDDEFQDAVAAGMQTKYPDFKKGMLPRGFIPKQRNRIQYDIDSLPTYVLPSEMLISLYYLYVLMRIVYSNMDWTLVFSFYYPPTPAQGCVRDPPVPIYGSIVSREYDLVIDLFKFLEVETNGRRDFDSMIHAHESEDEEVRKFKVMTCDDPDQFLELVKLYNKDEKAANSKGKKDSKSDKETGSKKFDKNLIGMIVNIVFFICMVIYTVITKTIENNTIVEDGANPTETPFTTEGPKEDL